MTHRHTGNSVTTESYTDTPMHRQIGYDDDLVLAAVAHRESRFIGRVTEEEEEEEGEEIPRENPMRRKEVRKRLQAPPKRRRSAASSISAPPRKAPSFFNLDSRRLPTRPRLPPSSSAQKPSKARCNGSVISRHHSDGGVGTPSAITAQIPPLSFPVRHRFPPEPLF